MIICFYVIFLACAPTLGTCALCSLCWQVTNLLLTGMIIQNIFHRKIEVLLVRRNVGNSFIRAISKQVFLRRNGSFYPQANETGMPERASYPVEDKTCFGGFLGFFVLPMTVH